MRNLGDARKSVQGGFASAGTSRNCQTLSTPNTASKMLTFQLNDTWLVRLMAAKRNVSHCQNSYCLLRTSLPPILKLYAI
jgi:hypothetical protein